MYLYKKRGAFPHIAVYAGFALAIFITFLAQTSSPPDSILLFSFLFLTLYFSISELMGISAGIYATIFIILLQISYPTLNRSTDFSPYFTIAVLQIILTLYYIFIKKLREKRFELTFEREKHFRSLANLNLQPLILKNERGEVLFASESIKKLLGLKKNLPTGKTIAGIVHPEDIHLYNNFLSNIVDSPGERQSVELRMKKGDNGWTWIKSDSVNMLSHKDIKAIVTSIQDITLQKELDREKAEIIKQEKYARGVAEKAVRDRDEFLSIASHELKTPLTTVLLQLQATLRKISTQSLADFSGTELLNSLQIAEKQSQSLSNLIKDLLNVSIVSTGRLTLNPEIVNLGSLTKSLIKSFDEEIKISKCSVKVSVKNKGIIGMWDPVRVEQAISNLLVNALKYSAGKDIKITVQKKNRWALFSIKDKGPGIAKDLQPHIFEPFKRVNNNTQIKGLGVGLFITKQIAKSHGGDLTVESEPNKGSTFNLWLPLLIVPEETKSSTQ